jgi:hypothetical protein
MKLGKKKNKKQIKLSLFGNNMIIMYQVRNKGRQSGNHMDKHRQRHYSQHRSLAIVTKSQAEIWERPKNGPRKTRKDVYKH